MLDPKTKFHIYNIIITLLKEIVQVITLKMHFEIIYTKKRKKIIKMSKSN